MEEQGFKWLVMLLQPWEDIEPPMKMQGNSVGCMLVFNTEDEARAEYPDASLKQIYVGATDERPAEDSGL